MEEHNLTHFTNHQRLLLRNICVLIFIRYTRQIKAVSAEILNPLETERFYFISVISLSKWK